MKILALVFICAIGVLLVLDSAGIHTSIEVLDMHMEKLMVYFAMIFAVVLEFIQMAFNSRLNAWKKQLADEAIDAAVREAEGGEEPAKVGEARPRPRGCRHRERRTDRLAVRASEGVFGAPGVLSGRLRTSLEFLEIRACIAWLLPL